MHYVFWGLIVVVGGALIVVSWFLRATFTGWRVIRGPSFRPLDSPNPPLEKCVELPVAFNDLRQHISAKDLIEAALKVEKVTAFFKEARSGLEIHIQGSAGWVQSVIEKGDRAVWEPGPVRPGSPLSGFEPIASATCTPTADKVDESLEFLERELALVGMECRYFLLQTNP